MTRLKLLSGALIATAMLTTPVMAREHHVNTRYLAANAENGAPAAGRYVDGRLCIPAPRVGAFATQPWENGPPCEPVTGY
jgi:hypothetical protein